MKKRPDPLTADQALLAPPFGASTLGIALVATYVSPIEAAIDPVTATIEPPINAVALPVESTGNTVVALFVRAIRGAIVAPLRDVTAAVEALLDTIATIGTLQTIRVRSIILSQRRSAHDGQRQRKGRNEISLSHVRSP